MRYLVGDLQGCDEAFERLLAVLNFSPSRDHLTLLGDLVNRGPGSVAVLDKLMAWGSSAQALLGNHDLHCLAVATGARPQHHKDTLQPILASARLDAYVDWLRHRPLAVLECGWLCVHAGVAPSWTLAQTLSLADEVSAVLQGPQGTAFLASMYGQEPSRWDDRLQGLPRWRQIVDVLTRLRFCQADGTLDFKTKGGPALAPLGFMPWFEVPGRQTSQVPVAFGHWSTLGLLVQDTLLSTDTGCVWGGQLTAVRVDGGRREVLQVPCHHQASPKATT